MAILCSLGLGDSGNYSCPETAFPLPRHRNQLGFKVQGTHFVQWSLPRWRSAEKANSRGFSAFAGIIIWGPQNVLNTLFFATEAWDSHSFLYISFVSIINVPEFPRTRMFPGNSLVTHKNDAISNGPCKPKHWWFHDSLALFFPAMRVLEFYSGDRMAIAHNLIMKL